MRMTTGLLVTAALLLPGAAQAQFGGPGSVSPAAGAVPRLAGAAQAQYGGPGSPYDPLQNGLRPGVGGIPRLIPNPGLLPNPGAGGIPGVPGMPNITGVPDGYGPIGPGGIPGLPRSPYEGFGLDPSLRGVPGLPGRLGTPTLSQIAESNGAGLPGRLGTPNIPGLTDEDAGRVHLAPNLVPAAPNVPRTLEVIDPSKTWVSDYKRDRITPRPTPSPLGGWTGALLGAFLLRGIVGAIYYLFEAIFGWGKKGSKG